MFDKTKLEKIVRDSGLTKLEIARLFGISRQTLYTWLEGKSMPKQDYMKRLVGRGCESILNAMKMRVLPMSVGLTKLQRRHNIGVMAQKIQSIPVSQL